MDIIKDFEYYERELKAILNGDVDTLKEHHGYNHSSIQEYVAEKFPTYDGEPTSGFMINDMYGIENAVDDIAYIVFDRANNVEVVAGYNGDFFLKKGNRMELVDENGAGSPIYELASKSDLFARNEFEISDFENSKRVEANMFVIEDDDIKPIKKLKNKP
ncbi:hypothetical protein GR140_19050 [Pseudomonas putida]|uniref:hypothetical protein n=1 Tax=Pseudomonas putida TaxID=303 RepID=UPI001BB0C400|nr:hypothetical protein [Pseudomonas putida]QUG90764.1 hypothetical protein GR140_19050 [Pseudomonas putida]